METKKIFEAPICEVVRFTVEDIIASSTIRTNWDTDEYAFE